MFPIPWRKSLVIQFWLNTAVMITLGLCALFIVFKMGKETALPTGEHDWTLLEIPGRLALVGGLCLLFFLAMLARMGRFVVHFQEDMLSQIQTRTQALKEKVTTLDALSKISNTVLGTSRDVEQVLELVLPFVDEALPSDRVVVSLLEWEKHRADLFAYEAGAFQKLSVSEEPEDSPHLQAVQTGAPLVITDLLASPQTLDSRPAKRGFRSLLAVPLTVRRKNIGALNVLHRAVHSFSQGEIDRALQVSSHLAVALDNAQANADLEETLFNTITGLAEAVDARDAYTGHHSQQVAQLAEAIGSRLGLTGQALETVRIAGLLHDIGKIGIEETILRKTDRLTEEEFAVMRQHPVIGARILRPLKKLRSVSALVYHHHERYDGRGYPDGQKGSDIELGARILALADSIDAMNGDRPYRPRLPWRRIIEEIEKGAGTQFDPALVPVAIEAFQALQPLTPVNNARTVSSEVCPKSS
ncbi:HD domain-containing protein [Heliobacterium gestii]|uniref:HD domain-containing protein n=1 Tax=Heliomicrobium gestii TaxID=2699 RepID=A0A845LNL0_HELGE|nr:HD domain-containing phosphohydrolase [Heliomicrobium gestii]MBM7868273.1 putative nucleotidyltransferase with HDIG domain [Heliomicrobium gestii]MZP44466.1 HD domain-containing protein [Heliomicrobium gestii]